MKFTDKQIEDYKKKYGKVFLFESGDKSCLLKKAGRNDLSLAEVSAVSKDESGKSSFDTNKYNESILLSCWIEGDEEIKTDDELYLGIIDKISIITKYAIFEVKEL
jgi:hypothetical protein